MMKSRGEADQKTALPGNRELDSIFNSDDGGVFTSGKDITPAEYGQAVREMLDNGMTVLAQCVGMPDPVIYRSQVATTMDKHVVEVGLKTWYGYLDTRERSAEESAQKAAYIEGFENWAEAMRRLRELDTDALTITIEECRKRGVPIVASYRMNAEDWYGYSWMMSDFGRTHPEWRIPFAEGESGDPECEWTGALDPAIPQVYEHHMAIFREVVESYDIDGIEFDFRRWYHMISNPLENHPILTKMVRETRQMLDEVARKKGRQRLIFGVRVGPSLDSEPNPSLFPGIYYAEKPTNASCRELGLDVKTWINQAYVDYVCPALFCDYLPGLPLTKEFVALAKGTNVGIYPTVFSSTRWMNDAAKPVPDSPNARRKHRDEIVQAALKCYADGADGISTFNWPKLDPDSPAGRKAYSTCEGWVRVCRQAHPALASPAALRRLLKASPPDAGLATNEKIFAFGERLVPGKRGGPENDSSLFLRIDDDIAAAAREQRLESAVLNVRVLGAGTPDAVEVLLNSQALVRDRATPPASEPAYRELDNAWRFAPDPEDKGVAEGWHKPEYADVGWAMVRSDTGKGWDRQGFAGYHGVGWYRQTFRADDDLLKRKAVWLLFGGVDKQAEVYLNGKLAFAHTEQATGLPMEVLWNQPFAFNARAFLEQGENTLAVRVQSLKFQGGVYRPAYILLQDETPTDPSRAIEEILVTESQAGWLTLQPEPSLYRVGDNRVTIRGAKDAAGGQSAAQLTEVEVHVKYRDSL